MPLNLVGIIVTLEKQRVCTGKKVAGKISAFIGSKKLAYAGGNYTQHVLSFLFKDQGTVSMLQKRCKRSHSMLDK